jgi:pyrroline-5-carboxylate reductase
MPVNLGGTAETCVFVLISRDESAFFYGMKGEIQLKTIVFIGAGSMAEAIIAGIVEQGALEPQNVFVMNKSDDERLISLQHRYGVSIVCKEKVALKNADLVVLATKPKDIHRAMADTLPYLADTTAVLSVIAGISIQTIESGLGARPIARSMPNTSATIGKSATGIAMNTAVDEKMRRLVLDLLESIGMVKEVEEDDLHAVTALSGSGPAYVYYLAEALEEAAIDKGLSKDIARALIIQTLEGAAAMLKETGTEPAELRKNVTSPGGTTQAGLEALVNGMFKETIADCIGKAEARSRILGSRS